MLHSFPRQRRTRLRVGDGGRRRRQRGPWTDGPPRAHCVALSRQSVARCTRPPRTSARAPPSACAVENWSRVTVSVTQLAIRLGVDVRL